MNIVVQHITINYFSSHKISNEYKNLQLFHKIEVMITLRVMYRKHELVYLAIK